MTRVRQPEGRPLDLFSPSQVARIKGVTDTAVRHAIRAGTIPAQKVGNQWIIKRRDLDAWTPRRPGDGKRFGPRPKQEEANGKG